MCGQIKKVLIYFYVYDEIMNNKRFNFTVEC